jgi:hypothetical protein
MEGADGCAKVSLNEDDFPTRPPEVIFRANSLDGVLPATRNKRPTSLATSVTHRPREPVLADNSCSERRHIQLFISEEDDSPVNQLLTRPRNETHHQLIERLTNPERERSSADQLSQPQNRNAEHIHERNRSDPEEQNQSLLGNTNVAEQNKPVNNLNQSSEQDLHIWRSVSDQSEQSQRGNSNSSRRKAQIVSRKEATEARKGGSEWRSAASDLRWSRNEAEQRADSGNFSLLAEHINRNILACFICSAKFVDPKVKVVAFFKGKIS